MKIEDAVVLVTGANRGIGRALVEESLARGARRVYAAVRSRAGLDFVAGLDRARIVPLQLDITDRKRVAGTAAQAPDVTLLINNAGVAAFASVLDGPRELVARDIDTNYYGTLDMVRTFAPVIEANGGGGVVNFLTIVALASMPGLGVYNASKAAAWSMTQSIRAELTSKGIAVHGVFPGAVDTDMIRALEMPKTDAREVAHAVLGGVAEGVEDIFPDPMAQRIYEQWRQDHKAVERQFATM